MFSVSVQPEDFNAGAEAARLAAIDGAAGGEVGAVASFVGYVRGDTQKVGAGGTGLELEHYPGMTEKSLAAIVAEARERWPLLGVRVIHRHGALAVGAQIVLVAVAARHRGDAFAACEFIMDYLKTRAPFWKRESSAEGARWVDARDSDAAAAARWGAAG